MARRDRGHRSGAFLRWFPVLLVLALLAAGGAAWRWDLGPRWFGTGDEPDPREEPAAVAPPEGLELPPLADPEPLAAPGDTADGRAAAVRRALRPLLDDPDLGPHVLVAVGDLDGTGTLLARGDDAAIPASTTKLLTSAAALEVLGPDHVFTTAVVARGRQLVLVGGGDPLLARKRGGHALPERADLPTLAADTARVLRERGVRKVRLGYDDSLFSGPVDNPFWRPDYVPSGVVSPITALWVDEGREADGSGYVADPSLTAATELAGLLARHGVRVTGPVAQRRAPQDAEQLAAVESAPLEQVVERVLLVSDNEASEVLAHHVGLAVHGKGSFAAGARAVVDTLDGLGVRTAGIEVHDGSGLSRENLLTSDVLLDVLRLAAGDRPDLRAVLTGLPVAGFSGSLEFRPGEVPLADRGRVRAKTGTLSGVSGLAGTVATRDGAELAFVVLADEVDLVDTLDARAAMDDLAAALGACRCAA